LKNGTFEAQHPRSCMSSCDQNEQKGSMDEMSVKDMAKAVIDKLPDEASMDDIIHALYIRTKFERGIQEIEDGKGVPHEEAKERMRSWVKNG
jgi:predicted transcriptional regulator